MRPTFPVAALSHITVARATTNAGLRAGLPTLILWTLPDQGAWGARVKRLKVGTGRRFSATTEKSLVADLRTVLARNASPAPASSPPG